MRRGIYNSSLQSVGNGDQAQFQINDQGGLLVAQHGSDVITVNPTLDTSAYTSGDVLFDATAIAGAVRFQGGRAKLSSIVLLDKDDQGIAMNLVFLSANTSLGTFNAAPDIDDTELLDVVGHVAIASGDYLDLGGSRVATLRGLGLVLEAAAASTTLYVAAITGGTPTHTAAGLRFKFGFEAV